MLTDQGKISSLQLAMMVFPSILATAILSVPSLTMIYAGHDMWLSPILGSVVGLAAIGISLGLHRLYPGQTILQASVQILSWWPGKLVGLLLLVYLPHLNGLIIRSYGEFIASNALPKTPFFVIMGTMCMVCAINVKQGIEVVGRTAQVFVSILVVLLCLIFILLIGELNPAELLPFMENGIMPSVKGAVPPAAWFSEYIILAFLFPYVNHKKGMGRTMLVSLVLTTAAMTASNLFCLFLMGDLTDSFSYPFMIAARYITIADFLQHIEAIIIAIWIFGIFVKISVFLYIYSASVAEWLGMKDYRPLVFPLAFLCLVYSYWVVSGHASAANLISGAANLYTLTLLLVLPSCLYGYALLKRMGRTKGKKGGPSS